MENLTDNEKEALKIILESVYHFLYEINIYSSKLDIDADTVYNISEKLGINI